MSNDKTNIDYDMVSLSRQIALLEQRSRRLSTKDDPHGGLMDADEADALRRVRTRLQRAEAECERMRKCRIALQMVMDEPECLDGRPRTYEEVREALATSPPEDKTEHWVGTWDEQADVPLCDWKPGMRKDEEACDD